MRSFTPTSVIVSLVEFVTAALEMLLGARFVLRLFGANPKTPFVVEVYKLSQYFLDPFRDIFPTTVLDKNFVIDFTSVFAIVIYAIGGYLVAELLMRLENNWEAYKSRRKPSPTERQYKST